MSKKSKMNKSEKRGNEQAVILAELAELVEGVKESRIDNSYSRKQAGKNRDKARREQSKLNRRKVGNRR